MQNLTWRFACSILSWNFIIHATLSLYMNLFSSWSLENSVQGGDPMTSIGLSFSMADQHLSRSALRSKSKPLLMSIDMPGSRPNSRHTPATRSGLKISATSAELSSPWMDSAIWRATANSIRLFEYTSWRLWPKMARHTISSSSRRAWSEIRSIPSSSVVILFMLGPSAWSAIFLFVAGSFMGVWILLSLNAVGPSSSSTSSS